MHILVIEDDERIAANLKTILSKSGFQVTVSRNGEDGLFQAEEEGYDAVILDWMLPDTDGVVLCTKLRAKHNPVPILMLTAKSQVEDKVESLSSGADDYLTKPFNREELIARVKALIRRSGATKGSPLVRIKKLVININTAGVALNGRIVEMAPKEYALLEYLAVNKNKVIDRMDLLHHVWGEDIDPLSNTVDVHIRYIRKKLNDRNGILIKTVKNKGYMLCDN